MASATRKAAFGCMLSVGVTMTAFGFDQAWASQPPGHTVTICHATNSDTNPYVEITVDVSAAGIQAGHADHTGPIWNPVLKELHVQWGDIIPAFDYRGFSYPGMNVPAGDAWLANGCQDPSVVVGPTTSTTSSGGQARITVPTGAVASPGGQMGVIPEASTVHTGKAWAGSGPYAVAVGVLGMGLLAFGTWGLSPGIVRRRRRARSGGLEVAGLQPPRTPLWLTADDESWRSDDLWLRVADHPAPGH